jgi:hypothetical protein
VPLAAVSAVALLFAVQLLGLGTMIARFYA